MKKSLLIKNCEIFSVNKSSAKKHQKVCIALKAKTVLVSLFIMLGISSLAYIFQINQLATMGQEINTKEQLLEELQEGNKSLEIEVARLKSSYYFEEERARLNLVNPDQISFIEVEKGETVAMIE
ncbi:MAG: septum formation initiator family protein [Candidatus Moranbacteria bacterium]|nr:septum formation initiator family protein [Candidatus Moranbacteria bacterium]